MATITAAPSRQFLKRFDGQLLASHSESLHYQICALTVIPTGAGGIAVFSWHRAHQLPGLFVKGLNDVPDAEIGALLVEIAFEYTDNLYCDPKWWATVPADTQERLLKRAHAGTPENRACVGEWDKAYASWEVVDWRALPN